MDEIRNICIVEDFDIDRATYRRWLTGQGGPAYHIFECEDLASAIDLCANTPLDALLLDYQLPDGSGLDFLKNLSRIAIAPPPATIILTGQGSETVAVAAIKAGAQDYLVKGDITPERLNHAIDRAIVNQQLQYKFQQQQQLQQLIADTALNIRNSLVLSDILREAVNAVCNAIAIDRAFIYRFNTDMGGQVVAEALDGPWPSALHQHIDDTCFRQNGAESYLSGRIVAIEDIYAADLTPCHRNLLQGFGVRANLIIPILLDAPLNQPALQGDDDRDRPNSVLWGLLGVHACRGPRQWAAFECNLLRQLSIQLSIAIQQAELYERLTVANHHLEQQVWERTHKLQAADQQLRLEIEQRGFAQADVASRQQLLQDFFTAAAQAGIGMAIHDRHGIFIDLNQTMAAIGHSTIAELVGQSLFDVRPDLAPTLQPVFEQVLTDGTTVNGISCQSRADRRAPLSPTRTWIASYFPVGDREGTSPHIGSILIEVTELHRSQERLVWLSDALGRSKSELEEFAAIASDDLQTTLVTVQEFATALARRYQGQWPAHADHYLNSITTGIDRLQATIADLLTYARIDCDDLADPIPPAALNGVVQTVLERFGDRDLAQYTHIDPLPQVLAPLGYLEQLFQRLIDNAWRYRRNVPLQLSVRHLPPLENSPAYHCHLAVIDNGCGVAPQDYDRIFQLFQRVADRNSPSTGLGLAICRKIVETLGGTMWVESEFGRSSAFHFTLPLATISPASSAMDPPIRTPWATTQRAGERDGSTGP